MDIAAVLTAPVPTGGASANPPAVPATEAFAGLLDAMMVEPANAQPVVPARPAAAVVALPIPVAPIPQVAPSEAAVPVGVPSEKPSVPTAIVLTAPPTPPVDAPVSTEVPVATENPDPLGTPVCSKPPRPVEAPSEGASVDQATPSTRPEPPPAAAEEPGLPAPPRRTPAAKAPRAEAKAVAPPRGRPKPPEASPPDAILPTAAPEEEAETPAPNAPVSPLDQNSETATPEAPPIVPRTATPVQPGETPPAAPKATVPSRSPLAVDAARLVEASASPSIPDRPVVAENAAPAPTPAANEIAPPRPDVPRFAAAPDLDVVPQVVVAPSAPNGPPTSAPATPPVPVAPVETPPNAGIVEIARAAQVPAPKPPAKRTPAAVEGVPKVQATDAPAPRATAQLAALPEAFTLEPALAPEADIPAEGGDSPVLEPLAAPVAKSAATERPTAGPDRPSVDRHLVVRQVADRIESLVAARPKDGVTVHLEPRDLGTVTLVVKGLAHALEVSVSASDERVRQSLDAARPELAQALAPRGLALRELRVAPPAASTAMNPDGGNPDPRREGRPRPQHAPAYAKKADGPTAVRAARRSGRGVDLLV